MTKPIISMEIGHFIAVFCDPETLFWNDIIEVLKMTLTDSLVLNLGLVVLVLGKIGWCISVVMSTAPPLGGGAKTGWRLQVYQPHQ